MIMRYDQSQIDQFINEVQTEGLCILRDHLPVQTLNRWRERFLPLLHSHIEREGHIQNRGSQRFYVTLPFIAPFADENIFANPDVLAIVENLVGRDFTMVQLATDTPLKGSDYQELHRDAPPLFPETGSETPAFQLAVNFPLVDVTPDNGPFETSFGTHLMTKEEGLRRIETGEIEVKPLMMKVGDLMIRDVRGIHRGTPNRTDQPRPMCVIGYSRRWLFRPEVSIRIPHSTWTQLSDLSRQMLRHNPRVESLDEIDTQEIYQAFAY